MRYFGTAAVQFYFSRGLSLEKLINKDVEKLIFSVHLADSAFGLGCCMEDCLKIRDCEFFQL
eukprot:m.213952 g.213952  ORF g.213952 m.213952 type:complete len:62 (+) comp39802_c1_seq17:790-975(+)